MAVQPFFNPRFRAFDSNGDPLAGGLLYAYAAGTTTPQATYTTRAGSVANANPIVLDANGEADVWCTPGVDYKFVLKTSAGVTQWTVDNVPSPTTSDTLEDGTVNAPSLAFMSDSDTGLYRIGANNLGVTVGATKVVDATSTGVTFPVAVTASAGITANPTGDTSPTIDHTRTSGLRQLFARIAGTGGGSKSRISNTPTALELCQNLYFDGTDWRADTTAGASLLAIVGSLFHLYSTTGHTAGGVATILNPMVIDATNPAATAGQTNTLAKANIPKAWAVIQTDGAGGASVVEGFNVASASASGTALTVTFATGMASANYAADCTSNNTANFHAYRTPSSNKATGSFRVEAYDITAAGNVNFGTSSHRLTVVVFAKQ